MYTADLSLFFHYDNVVLDWIYAVVVVLAKTNRNTMMCLLELVLMEVLVDGGIVRASSSLLMIAIELLLI